MPYKSEKIKIANTKYDRRIKLTDEQREAIREEYAKGEKGARVLAKEYGVSRSLIRFVVMPEKYERSKEMFRERRKDGRYDISSEEWRDLIKERRRYKQKLYLEGKIGNEEGG
jgi:hypothetical protein